MEELKSTYPTIVYEGKSWSGMTTELNLANMYGERPIDVSRLMDLIYTVNYGDDYLSKLNKTPVLELPDDREFQWSLMEASDVHIPLVKATDIAGNEFSETSKAGLYFTPFYLYFSQKKFFQTHVIVGTHPDLYNLYVMEDPVQVGSLFRVKVQIVGSSNSLYIPYSEIQANTKWAASYSLSEQTLSRRGSDISFNSPFRLANRMSMLRKEHTIPGNMIDKGKNEPVTFNWQVSTDGKTVKQHSTWLNRLDWEFDNQFRREVCNLLYHGFSNKLPDGSYANKGASGYEIKAGLSLEEQISPANTLYINSPDSFSIDILIQFLRDISYGKLPEDRRYFLIGTGEYGLGMASKAIEEYAGTVNTIETPGIDYNRVNAISTNGRYSTYTRPQYNKVVDIQGIVIEFMLLPEHDNFNRYVERYPGGGLLKSYEMTIMDFGTNNGHPNIQRVAKKNGGEVFAYIPGLRDPYRNAYGPDAIKGTKAAPKAVANGVDGYTIHRAFWGGTKVHNPRRMGKIKFNAY